MSVAYSDVYADTDLADGDLAELDRVGLGYAQPWPSHVPGRRLRVVPASAPLKAPARAPRTGAPASIAVLHAPLVESLPVRLTHRGVVVLAAAVLALGAAVVAVAAWCAPSPAVSVGPAVVTVHAGDTLWSIASSAAPNTDPRAEVATIERLNGLRGASLVPGQQLRVR